MKKIALVLGVLGFAASVFWGIPAYNQHTEDSATLKKLEDRQIKSLNLNEKVLLFRIYQRRSMTIELIEIVGAISDAVEIQHLTKEEKIFIASKAGEIIGALDTSGVIELNLYERFLKPPLEGYHHLFRAISFKRKNNLQVANQEIEEAKNFTGQDSDLSKWITKIEKEEP